MSNTGRILDPDAYKERVEYAARCIREGRTNSRNFSNCFEMYDGDHVIAALIRKADKSPTLAELLPKAITADAIEEMRERFKHCTSKQIEELAAQTRKRERAMFEAIFKLIKRERNRKTWEQARLIAIRYVKLCHP